MRLLGDTKERLQDPEGGKFVTLASRCLNTRSGMPLSSWFFGLGLWRRHRMAGEGVEKDKLPSGTALHHLQSEQICLRLKAFLFSDNSSLGCALVKFKESSREH